MRGADSFPILRAMVFENKPYHLLVTPELDAVSRLRAAFNAARYGHYFRTLTMVNGNTMNHEWLYAVQDPLSHRCTLMKVQESPDTDMEQRSVVGEHLNFLDVLEKMARFDSVTANPGMTPAIENEKESLNLSHYHLFANREGLAFDHGTHTFHPTMNSHIVTSGMFNKEELKRVYAYNNMKNRPTDPFPVPSQKALLQGMRPPTEEFLSLFHDNTQLDQLLTFYRALHKLEQFWVDKNQSTFSIYSLDTAVIDPNFINETKKTFENPGRFDKARTRLVGDPYEGRQSAFFYSRIIQRLQNIQLDHPDLQKRHQKALKDHEFCFEFALARRNAIKIAEYHASIADKKEAAQFLKNRTATLDKLAAKRGISPEGIAGLHAAIYGGKLPSVFAETAAFLELLQKTKNILQEDIRAKQRRMQSLNP